MALPLYLHGPHRKIFLGALSDVSLKQTREFTIQWRSVLRERCAPIKNVRNKSARQCAISII